MDTTLFLLLVIPVVLGTAAFFLIRAQGNGLDDWRLAPALIVPGLIIVIATFFASFGAQVNDTEIISGKVVSKDRVHGSYVRSYSCNCTSDSKGNQTCQTCYEDHYTVKWACDTTVGPITIDSKDWTSRAVYLLPDPQRYTVVTPGEPASVEQSYQNYVQAVPNSLFAALDGSVKAKFKNALPEYPRVFDFYRVNRAISVGVPLPDLQQWSNDISMMLRELGPSKQADIIVVAVRGADESYADALRDHWEGVNKNDVVIVVGTEDLKTFSYVRVISWTKNEVFKSELRDNLMELNEFDRVKFMNVVQSQIAKNFERRHMKDFEYLKGEIDPPTWLIWTLIIVLIAGYGAATFFIPRQFARRY